MSHQVLLAGGFALSFPPTHFQNEKACGVLRLSSVTETLNWKGPARRPYLNPQHHISHDSVVPASCVLFIKGCGNWNKLEQVSQRQVPPPPHLCPGTVVRGAAQ